MSPHQRLVLFAILMSGGLATDPPSTKNCLTVCESISKLYPSEILFPSSLGFQTAQQSYWNLFQREAAPSCFFQPTTSEHVSTAITQVVQENCPFSIKGGGHSSNIGASSITGGFQFDLAKMREFKVSDDRKSVTVGPGWRWGELLQELQPLGVIAVGGRDAGVGVPGFVFGDGSLVTANQTSHPDLYKALLGGGAHNFGIATALKLELHPYDGMWGGYVLQTGDQIDHVFAAYDKFFHKLQNDQKGHMILDITRVNGSITAVEFIGYPEPVENPPLYDSVYALSSSGSTLRLANYTDLAAEMAVVTNSRGLRNTYRTLTVEYDAELLREIFDIWAEVTEPHAAVITATLDINVITSQMRNRSSRTIKNTYGLGGATNQLIIVMFSLSWDDDAQDTISHRLVQDLGNAIENLANQAGKLKRFRYMNYAHVEQDVISSFGDSNKQLLKDVARTYDPNGVFQWLQPGGFKLDG
ncbi:uncharacterized protein BKA55DRAFT_667361 [Fusarium redolens]|uniref:FAD-binding PCMH-type domain-containing protein n=1 Tax=Fusarium redolens TaxID=48865 RepID=A0A9P9G4U0_FUSRE|nr:uncharacterized protein BKA55DRAFT_667361 [Fusarium redolens]KAH7232386.1 hypothetical protein BKA55DRAFT_667361 [Fusarium redolens]